MSRCIEAVEARPYPVLIGNDNDLLVTTLSSHIKPSQICIITDTNVGSLYEQTIRTLLEPLAPVITHTFEAGEHAKQLDTVQSIYDTLLEHHMDRSGLNVSSGGGVVGDLA